MADNTLWPIIDTVLYIVYKRGAGMGAISRALYAVLASRSVAAQCW